MSIIEESSYTVFLICAAEELVMPAKMPCKYAQEDQAKSPTKRNEKNNSIQEIVPRGPLRNAGLLHLARPEDLDVLLSRQDMKIVSSESSY